MSNSRGCTDATACNYDMMANVDNGSCLFVGNPCDDMDSGTNNDAINNDCVCVGIGNPYYNGVGYNCPPYLIVNNSILSNYEYSAQNSVMSNSKAISGNDHIIKAGSFIQLNSGFEIEANSNTDIIIDSCD